MVGCYDLSSRTKRRRESGEIRVCSNNGGVSCRTSISTKILRHHLLVNQSITQYSGAFFIYVNREAVRIYTKNSQSVGGWLTGCDSTMTRGTFASFYDKTQPHENNLSQFTLSVATSSFKVRQNCCRFPKVAISLHRQKETNDKVTNIINIKKK